MLITAAGVKHSSKKIIHIGRDVSRVHGVISLGLKLLAQGMSSPA
jgi:hypothetical protein